MKTLTKEELLQMYDWVGSFWEGLAQARKNGKWFHIRPDGTPAYEQRYDYTGPFQDGLAQVRKGNEWLQIRPNGTRAG